MKKLTVVLLTSLVMASLTQAQSLNNLKDQYEKESPIQYQEIAEQQLVEPEESDKTPAEEMIAERQEQDLEKQKEQEERIYLDTDYRFFQSLNIILDEDELDQAYKAKLAAENLEKIKNTDATVKTELTTTAPTLFRKKEAVALDEKRTLILNKIASNGQQVRACILQHKDKEEFKGTAMTLSWEVEPSGKVANAQMKATDVENQAIQACVLKSLAEWNFGEAMKASANGSLKNSQVEYTYRFVNSRKEAAAN